MNYNISIDELIEGFLREDIVIHCPTQKSLKEIKKELKNRNIPLADYCSKDNWNTNKENTSLAYINSGLEYFIENVENFNEDARLDFDKYLSETYNRTDEERLLELLKYSKEAIDYWFRDCDCSEDNREENDKFKEECNYFIKKLDK